MFDPAHPRTVQNICEKLIEIAEAFHEARYARIKGTETEVQEQLIGLQERIRLHTQVMRNWGYYRQVVEILRRLYAPLDDHFERLVGLKATELIVVFDRMIQSIEKKSSKFREKLAAAVSQKTKAHLIEEYFRQFEIPDQGKISEFVKFSKEQELSRKNIIVLLISHSGLHLADVYRFEAEEIAEWKAGMRGLSKPR